MLTYDFRLPPGPRTVEYALLAEELGFRAVWCPEIPAFGQDIWITLARIAEKVSRHSLHNTNGSRPIQSEHFDNSA
jgi:alkanesulfonate monooxygenase SsuD/methylene tetrahydromethanopterin reductase-like flavin-dependent oxidoreductase (luciferase family)